MPRQRTIAVGIWTSLPGQAGDLVLNGQPASAEGVVGWMMMCLGVLTVKRLPGIRRRDGVAIVETFRLAGIHHGVGQAGGPANTAQACRQHHIPKPKAIFHECMITQTTLSKH